MRVENKSGFKYYVREGREEQDALLVEEIIVRDDYNIKKLYERYPSINTAIDIGGHIGTFGYQFKRFYKEAKIFAFEPCTISYELYVKNMAENNLSSDVKVFNRGVTYDKSCNTTVMKDSSTAVSVFLSEEEAKKVVNNTSDHPCASIFSWFEGNYSIISTDVKPITFDEILKENNIEKVDFLKLDCEGAEVSILSNMSEEAARKIDILFCEHHLYGGSVKLKELMGSKFDHLTFLDVNLQPYTFTEGTVGVFYAVRK